MNRNSVSVDLPLMALALVATLVGLFFIFDAGYARSLGDNHGSFPPEFRSQLLFLVPSIAAGLICTRIHPNFWIKVGPLLWIANLVLLALVLKFGIEKNGAKRWLGVDSFGIQPAEFAKLTAVIYLSGILATRKPWAEVVRPARDWAQWMDNVFVPKFLRMLPGFLVLLAAGLIDKEPDLGTAAVVAATGFALFLVGGVSRVSLICAVCVAGLGGVLLVKEEPYRIDRIVNHVQRWDPKNVDDVSYQTVQSELAMATGGWLGVGIGNGRAKHVISAPTTDFIMATVAEEFGLLGALGVIAIIGGLVLRLAMLGRNAATPYARIVLFGTASWIGIQACVNIMMANGFVPAIGIPLPFISSGGSSLFALWSALGVCQAVAFAPARSPKEPPITHAVVTPADTVRRTPPSGNLGASFYPLMSNMDLVVTGGGTGGHIYPTLAVAAAAAADGATIRYLGSYRGQERAICKASNIEFKSFDAQPIYSMKTPAGWLSAIRLVRASSDARRYLRKNRPELVFSTGGYSAAPVVSAARSLRIPYVIHESNSVPGRSNAMFVKASRFFTCTFEATKSVIPKAERTGQPVRKELRVAANKQRTEPATSRDVVLGIGGSQGSTFLNKTLIEAAKDFSKKRCRFVLAAGRNNFMEVQQTLSSPEAPDNFKAVTYLELPDLVDTYGKTVIAVGRSGGTVAEMAMFGLPSVLIPLPTAFANHQMINAQEMERIGGAVVLDQAKTSGKELANAIRYWLESPEKREAARTSLQEWDIPDATERIYSKLIAALAAPA